MNWFIPRAVPGLLGAGLLLCGAAPYPANAADDAAQLAAFFTSTLEIDVPAGDWSAKRFLAPDHTYRESGDDGEVHGTWAVKDGRICTTADRSLGDTRAKTYCNTGLGKKAGDAWRDADPVTGNPVLFKLTPGR